MVNQPAPGVVLVVSVGSTIHEKSRYYINEEVITSADEPMRVFTYTINPDQRLFPEPSKAKFKACAVLGPCVVDDDGDGTFDRMIPPGAMVAWKMKKPVRYSTRREQNVVEDPDNFRQVLLYAGATGDTLRVSYREFSKDMARAAFTEELSIPITKLFPQVIAVKDLQLRLFSIDGMGLRYEVVDPASSK